MSKTVAFHILERHCLPVMMGAGLSGPPSATATHGCRAFEIWLVRLKTRFQILFNFYELGFVF